WLLNGAGAEIQGTSDLHVASLLQPRPTVVAVGPEQSLVAARARSAADRFNQSGAVAVFPLPRARALKTQQHDRDSLAVWLRRRNELRQDIAAIEDLLQDGARRARQEAEYTLELAREAVGLGRLDHATPAW